MQSKIKIVSTQEAFPIIREVLTLNKRVKFKVSGYSMLPWIVNNRDQVIIKQVEGKNLRQGDIILFQNKYGNYILHRIYKVDDKGYRTIGDACLWDDGEISDQDVIGVVEKIIRKGKEIDCTVLFWRILFGIWLLLLPVRKYLMQLYYLATKLKVKINKRKLNDRLISYRN